MPPQIIKTFNSNIKPRIIQLASSMKNAETPPQYVKLLLEKCKQKWLLNQIHAHMTTTGLIHNLPLASKLVAATATSTPSVSLMIAARIDGLDTYTWNTIIRGYAEADAPEEAIPVFAHMRKKGWLIDTYTLLHIIKACGSRPFIDEGEQIHSLVLKLGFASEVIIQTALLNIYALFDRLRSVQKLFDETSERDVVMWNALVAAYFRRNMPDKALAVAQDMVMDGVRLDGKTAVSILSACALLMALREGKAIHGFLIRNSVEFDVFVHNALINMYAKCRFVLYAYRSFQRMPVKNVVSWTSIIKGYGDNNYPDEALALFREMESKYIRPDEVTILEIVSLCSKLGSFELGQWIDWYVEDNRFTEKDTTFTTISNALIDMHAKCGNIRRACQIFDNMMSRSLVSWTSMIQTLAMHGYGLAALIRFTQMQREGHKPDHIVFLNILNACSHSGMVDEGRKCFDLMIKDYHIEPSLEHYGCLVDLLCRAGLVSEALYFVKNMQIQPDMTVWRILIRACQSEGDVILAGHVVSSMPPLESKNSEDYLLLSNLHAAMAEWDSVKEVREELGDRGRRRPGTSVIE